jgi:hypothetical protein
MRRTSLIDRTILTLCHRILHKTSHRILLKRVLNQATRRTSIIEAGGLQTSVMTVWQAKDYATHVPNHLKRIHRPTRGSCPYGKGAHGPARDTCPYGKDAHAPARDTCPYKRRLWKLPRAQYKS